ncbi:PfkB domain protein [Gloeothece citriformis PCC 7424]|uniref:PfkB domain protein n=1 Tax=Gloeothece citriformis (strain PCC 7424) TaxID=65393 RepID=B7KAR2_GLOC7|nr:carbohydrate kinase [Gloeothece citriformis]ACK68734.1 PfkB domain protein [Gloeothece citriformis PCC 7424]
MNSPRVLCLGEILFDLLADQSDRSVDQVESWKPYPGGAPANVACGLVKLGTTAGFIGCVGEDAPGQELVSLLDEVGVDTTGIQRHPTAPTRQVYVTRSAAGERQFAGFGKIGTEKFADAFLSANKLPESLFTSADYLVTGTLELAYPESQKAVYRAIELAQKHKVKILIDINWRPVFWLDQDKAFSIILELLKEADLIKCSEEEAQGLFNTDNPVKIAQQLNNIKGVLVTAGEQGCAFRLGDYTDKLGVFPVKTVDTTGAGDSFVSGFIHQCCLQGDKIFQDAQTAKQAVKYASAAGALTTTKPGAIAAQPTAREIEEFLSNKI